MSSIKRAVLITSGDLRHSANEACWPAQAELEEKLTSVFAQEGCELVRAQVYDPMRRHGFVASQREGMKVFATIDPETPVVFATAAWQYTHHVLPGLRSHRAAILTVANWSGQWPGLVGLLNLNGSLTKAGVSFSSVWSERFEDDFALSVIREWLARGYATPSVPHVRPLDIEALSLEDRELGDQLAAKLHREKAILGVFDEGCMGMYNAIVDDEILNRSDIFKERLSQSALFARMLTVTDPEAQSVRSWLDARGLNFVTGAEERRDLTDAQILMQCKMYIAALRMADEFGCDAIGIQYQQGLKDLTPASDLVEGLLNNPDRPPVWSEDGSKELFAGDMLPHFNEVDECAGVDALVTHRCWRALGLDPSTTLHDIRWGEAYRGDQIGNGLDDGKKGDGAGDGVDTFVWLWQISGAAPASHFVGGYAESTSERQPPMYFPLGGGTLKGVGRPGTIVWSRVFVEAGAMQVDLGLARVVTLPAAETERRWNQVTSQWPIVSVITDGITRDQFMARHRANHVSIAYAGEGAEAKKALSVKAAMFTALRIKVHLCGRPLD